MHGRWPDEDQAMLLLCSCPGSDLWHSWSNTLTGSAQAARGTHGQAVWVAGCCRSAHRQQTKRTRHHVHCCRGGWRLWESRGQGGALSCRPEQCMCFLHLCCCKAASSTCQYGLVCMLWPTHATLPNWGESQDPVFGTARCNSAALWLLGALQQQFCAK